MSDLCGCIRCYDERAQARVAAGRVGKGFRYACELCGNKRCPHHSDHRLECTQSNEPGQPGSVFTKS